MRFYIALFVAKCARLGIRIFGKALHLNGSHFPGNLARRIDPEFYNKVAKPETIIAVTGTNGKTTTCNMIIDVLEKTGHKVLSNKAGSNTIGGISTTFLSGVTLFNKPKYKICVLEVDERSSLRIYPYIKPNYLVVTNLFRDSLKRNAHSEFIFNIINSSLSEDTVLILNSDDLISNRMKAEGKNKKIFFGIDKLETDKKESVNIVNDARICPNCYTKLKYEFVRYHHIGKAYCPNCGYKSPEADYLVTKVDKAAEKIEIRTKDGKVSAYKMASDSIFNVYNEVACITLLREIGIKDEVIKKAFDELEIAKSRYMKETVNGVHIVNNLAKGQNPVACSIVFDYVKNEPGEKEVCLLIEDFHDNLESSENIAWFYDCDFEFLNDPSIKKVAVGGHRAMDVKFRLLLAGVPEEKIVAYEEIEKIPDELNKTKGETIYILYDMYEQANTDKLNDLLKKSLRNGGNN